MVCHVGTYSFRLTRRVDPLRVERISAQSESPSEIVGGAARRVAHTHRLVEGEVRRYS